MSLGDEQSRGQVTASHRRPFLRHEKSAHVDVLELQQLDLFADDARAACQIPAQRRIVMLNVRHVLHLEYQFFQL